MMMMWQEGFLVSLSARLLASPSIVDALRPRHGRLEPETFGFRYYFNLSTAMTNSHTSVLLIIRREVIEMKLKEKRKGI